jgi:hypothetical protein
MPSGFYNGSIMFADNVRFDGLEQPGQVTANGQLIIGSGVAPHLRVATLTAGTGISITNGAGSITIGLSGGVGTVTDVTTTNSTAQFTGVAVKNINFGITNLVFGSSMPALTTGINNTGLGNINLAAITSGEQNVAIGNQALQLLTTGNANTAVGRNSQGGRITGSSNTSLGQNALFSNGSGSFNTACGAGALTSYLGSNATAFGYLACRDTTGTGNTANGYISLVNCSTGTNNTGLGFQTLQLITTGSNNTCLGYNSGSALTVANSNNIFIGANVTGTAGDNNTLRIGSGQTRAFIQGIASVAVDNQQTVTINSATGQLGSIAGSVVQESQITLTSQQIKNLNATPIEIIPAQGAGTVIIVDSIVSKFIYGGNDVFVASAAQVISLSYGTTSFNPIMITSSIVSTTTNYSYDTYFEVFNFSTTGIENTALSVINPIATEISGNASNDNTIKILVKYFVVNI